MVTTEQSRVAREANRIGNGFPATRSKMELGTSTYSYLWTTDFLEALRRLAQIEYRSIELMASYPHPYRKSGPDSQLKKIRREAEGLDIKLVGVNPPGLDLNLVSPDPEFREFSSNRYRDLIHVSAELGSRYLVVVPGRRHPLAPVELNLAIDWLAEVATSLSELGSQEGIEIVLENTPSNFLDLSAELADFVRSVDSGNLGICYDVANAQFVEDPVSGFASAGSLIRVVHLSDTTRQVWRHDPIGCGQIDFAALWDPAASMSSKVSVILETIHKNDVSTGLTNDRDELRRLGWNV